MVTEQLKLRLNMNIHYTEQYLLDPTHRVSVYLIGAGGTGSQILSGLARMNEALTLLGHIGLKVTVFDPDIITEANRGRQLFSKSDIGNGKAVTLVTRINRFYGFDWEAMSVNYDLKQGTANIIITAVDTKDLRIMLHQSFKKKWQFDRRSWGVHKTPFYWLECGNSAKTGQVILSTLQNITQPASQHTTYERLKSIIDLFPNYRRMKEDKTPSCSLAEALDKQDLFINSTIAQYGLTLLWKLFREAYITQQGAFINLQTLKTNPIMI